MDLQLAKLILPVVMDPALGMAGQAACQALAGIMPQLGIYLAPMLTSISMFILVSLSRASLAFN